MKSPNNQERTIQTRCELKQEQKMEQRRAHRIQQSIMVPQSRPRARKTA